MLDSLWNTFNWSTRNSGWCGRRGTFYSSSEGVLKANDILRDVQARLMEPDRIIPGGFIYMSDILYDWLCNDTSWGNHNDSCFMDRNQIIF